MSNTRTSTYRQKSLAIESRLLNKIALIGTEAVAEVIGLDRTQISRWKTTRIPQIAKLLAVLEWEMLDEDITRIAVEVGELLIKKNAHVRRTHERLGTASFKPSEVNHPVQCDLFGAVSETERASPTGEE